MTVTNELADSDADVVGIVVGAVREATAIVTKADPFQYVSVV